MIYTLTLNPSIDYIAEAESIKFGGTNRTKAENIYPGGKGINVTLMLKNLGIDSVPLGIIAGFTGNEIKRLLVEQDINPDFVELTEGNSRINVKIRLADDAGEDNKIRTYQETELNGMGPSISDSDTERMINNLEGTLKTGDILVLAGSVPKDMPSSIYSIICEKLKDKKIKIIVDATKDLLINVLKYHPFLIKPNAHELSEIFDTQITNREDALKYAKQLQEMGAENVIVSLAEDGAVMVTNNGLCISAEAPKGNVINSVGAGDSMVAGFIAGLNIYDELNECEKYEKAFWLGICAGSASAFSLEMASLDDVTKLMGSVLG